MAHMLALICLALSVSRRCYRHLKLFQREADVPSLTDFSIVLLKINPYLARAEFYFKPVRVTLRARSRLFIKPQLKEMLLCKKESFALVIAPILMMHLCFMVSLRRK